MYKWPEELSPSEFVGRTVNAITFAEYTIVINLGDEVFLSIESELQLTTNDGEERIAIPPGRNNLTFLLGRKVEDGLVDGDGSSLLLKFEQGILLRVDGSCDFYECFQIHVRGTQYTV